MITQKSLKILNKYPKQHNAMDTFHPILLILFKRVPDDTSTKPPRKQIHAVPFYMHAFTFAYKSLLVVVPFTDCMQLPPQFQILWVFLGRPVAGLCCQGSSSDFRYWWRHSQSTLALICKSQAYGDASQHP